MRRILKDISLQFNFWFVLLSSVLFSLMGFYYGKQIVDDLQARFMERLALPAELIAKGEGMAPALFSENELISSLVGVEVLESFLISSDGTIVSSLDKKKNGNHYITYLEHLERRLLKQGQSQLRSAEFTDKEGNHFISVLSLVSLSETVETSLYLRANAEPFIKKKKELILLFTCGTIFASICAGALGMVIVSWSISPRIAAVGAVFHRVSEGDMVARIETIESGDQLGHLSTQFNEMMDQVEQYVEKQKVISEAAERLAAASTKDVIVREAVEIVEKHLPVVRFEPQLIGEMENEVEQETVFTLPITDDDNNYHVIPFVGNESFKGLEPLEREFVTILSRIVGVAVDRVRLFEEVCELEARYRGFFNTPLEGILKTSRDGYVVDVNQTLAEMVGYDSATELVGQAKISVVKLFADPVLFDEVRYLLESQEIIIDREIDIKRKDGTSFPVSLSGYSLMEENGVQRGYEFRFTNISERKRREQSEREQLAIKAVNVAKTKVVDELEWKERQLKETAKELKSAQVQLMQREKMAAVGMMAGGVAHDLNNILSGLVNYPELMLLTLPEESEMRGPVENILNSGKRAASVVSDLLMMTQGAVRAKKRVEIEPLIDNYIDSDECRDLCKDYPDIEVEVRHEALGAGVFCSPMHIYSLLRHLLLNGFETIVGTGKIEIITGVEDQDRGIDMNGGSLSDQVAVIKVTDNGPGIPEESLKHIFEPFYTRKVLGMSGTGMGLTLVWNIVNEHGGKIKVESSSAGTVFTIYLPLMVGEELEDMDADLQGLDHDLYGTGTILVVDDEALQRDIIKKMLVRFGYDVFTFSSGEEALSFLEEDHADLLVLDMLMPPGISGLETYRQALEINPEQKAIMISGYSENKDVKLAMQLGAGNFIKKPFTMQQIVQSVKSELDGSADEDEA